MALPFRRALGGTWTGMLAFHLVSGLLQCWSGCASLVWQCIFRDWLQSLVSDHKAEELAFTYPESTFFRDMLWDFFQICHVLGYALGLDDHVVHISLKVFF